MKKEKRDLTGVRDKIGNKIQKGEDILRSLQVVHKSSCPFQLQIAGNKTRFC